MTSPSTPTDARSGWTSVLCDSLEKVFPDLAPRALDTSIPQHAFPGERVSVQVAFQPPLRTGGGAPAPVSLEVIVDGAGVAARVSAVDLVPATFLAFEEHDEGYLRDTVGLYPDPLRPLSPGEPVRPYTGQWRAFWVDLDVDDDAPAGPVTVLAAVRTEDDTVAEHRFELTVRPETLPDQGLVNTAWFHCDGLATYYGDEVFSEEHWTSIDRFLRAAAESGISSVLTPVWTPPLDTAVGHYRLPTQLVIITERADGGYDFDFERLQRWMTLARSHGLTGLEIAHLFTQWGAEFTPAIYVERDGATVRRFGWDVPATDPSYRRLLEALIPALTAILDAEWGLSKVIFHVSDEPHASMIDSYTAAKAVVADLLQGCTIVDALSDLDFYETGAVAVPVAATDHAQPFLDAGVDPLWLYYCVGQHRDVSNRFIAMPSSRNRVLGTQLWLTRAAGFLHWGFNFYNAAHSTHPVDPFLVPDADGAFPAGDPFLVYPGPDRTPWPSLRSRVFAEAVDDLRLLRLAESRVGRDAVLAVVDPEQSVTLRSYSLDPNHYRRVRAALVELVGSVGLLE